LPPMPRSAHPQHRKTDRRGRVLDRGTKRQSRESRLAVHHRRRPHQTQTTLPPIRMTRGTMPSEDAEATDLRRWFSNEQTDIRDDIRVAEEVLAFIAEAGAKSVVMT